MYKNADLIKRSKPRANDGMFSKTVFVALFLWFQIYGVETPYWKTILFIAAFFSHSLLYPFHFFGCIFPSLMHNAQQLFWMDTLKILYCVRTQQRKVNRFLFFFVIIAAVFEKKCRKKLHAIIVTHEMQCAFLFLLWRIK